MEQIIRHKVFETNSSSVHSLTFGKTMINTHYLMDDFDVDKEELKSWFNQYIEDNFDEIIEEIRKGKSIIIDVDWSY